MHKIYKEYRIQIPLTMKEYNVGVHYTTIQMIKEDPESVKLIEEGEHDHPEIGQCRKSVKVLSLGSRFPYFVRALAPEKAFKIQEISYNAFPHISTHYTSLALSETTFKMAVLSNHHHLNEEKIESSMKVSSTGGKQYDVVHLDVYSQIQDNKYVPVYSVPVMECVKRVEIELDCFSSERIAGGIMRQVENLFLKTHQRILATRQEWSKYGLEDVLKRNV